jgi:hypothetical protein
LDLKKTCNIVWDRYITVRTRISKPIYIYNWNILELTQLCNPTAVRVPGFQGCGSVPVFGLGKKRRTTPRASPS